MLPAHLARALGMSESSISRWESGSSVPSVATVARIAQAVGVSLGAFWSDLPESRPQAEV